MSEPRPEEPALASTQPGYVPPQPEARARYVVVGGGDGNWLIQFEGEQFGPYRTEREAMLFAIDAAYNLGEHGRPTQVVVMDEQGLPRSVWTYGEDRFPPAL
jgi:hypothetical protein